MSTTLSIRRRLIAVFSGGFLGAITRYVLSTAIQSNLGKAWPYDILLINVTGALLLAFVTTLADATFLVGPTRRLFINVGFLGAYTTFSSLALGDVLLFAGGHWLPALLYLVLSITGGVLAIISGDLLGQGCIAIARPSMKHAQQLAGTLTPPQTTTPSHVDVQDDMLLPDSESEPETRRSR